MTTPNTPPNQPAAKEVGTAAPAAAKSAAKPMISGLRAFLLGGAAFGAVLLAGHQAGVTDRALSAFGTLVAPAAIAAETPAAPPATVVDVAHPELRRIIEWDDYTGRFAAVDNVEIRARVSGFLEQVHFQDGQTVTAGDLLFTIDQRPFRTALAEAQADLAAARAVLDNARTEAERGEVLVARGALSRQNADDRLQALREAEAAVVGAEARLDRAELELSFTEVRAPVSGRISDDAVSVGNLISAGDHVLSNIVSLDPIEFEFTVSEANYLNYVRLARTGDRESSRTAANPVSLQLMDETGFGHVGKMGFVDNQFNGSTGTMRGRAVFDNPDHVFTPGMFARIRLAGSAEYDAVLIPDAAVQTDQSEKFVWVADAADTAQRRTVELGPIVDGLRVVRTGLSAEDRLIIGGTQFVFAGAALAPKSPEPTQLAQAASK
ncbi:MAG: efflux RND transporter periplasmic adaptor subunit [Rhodospirillaceae bacterium]